MTGALRFNTGKPQLSRIFEFGSALGKLARVMSQGAIKYEDGNWLLGGQDAAQFLDSATRHIVAHKDGEFYDKDLGTAHLGMAAWNLLAALRILHDDAPDLDPEFDQEAFVLKYTDDSAHHELEFVSLTEDEVLDVMIDAVEGLDTDVNKQPRLIIDDEGDNWHLTSNGFYSMNPNNSNAAYTALLISEQYGIAEEA